MKELPTSVRDILETEFVDRYSVRQVVAAISDICDEKAAHVLENWNDYKLSRAWSKAGKLLDHCAVKLEM